jgi:ABC-type nickel/cobalt efflux system permease component RcnA
MKPVDVSRTIRRTVLAALLVTCTLALDIHSASAQIVPFGSPHGPVIGGIAGWVLAKQALFYRALAGMIRAAKSDGFALWGLMGISFVDGIFEPEILPWGHVHGPEPQELSGPGGWGRGLSAIVAVGIRPCSGEIIVLVFALAQGLFWAGIVSTFVMGFGTAITVAAIATLAVGAKALAKRVASRPTGYGDVFIRPIEFAAAALVLAFGALLLAGYMASERLIGI